MTHTDPTILLWILLFAVVGSVFSVTAAGAYLLLPERLRQSTLSHLISFATGVLLGVAFMHLLPHALELGSPASPEGVMVTVLCGIFTFFVLEKALIWRHAHHDEIAHGQGHHIGHAHAHPHDRHNHAGSLIVVGDTFHNFLDGVLLTAAFVTDLELGIVTGLAIVAHEIPQELGDFAILLNSGFSRGKAFLLNLISSAAMIVGALLAWWQVQTIDRILPYVLAFTASSFIYIAVADLIPTLHRDARLRETLAQMVLIIAGVLMIVAFQASHLD